MTACISATGLEMRFRGCDALRGIDLTVPTGSVFALLGENGAGKTTLIRILTGFLKQTAGDCQVCGLDPVRNAIEIRRRIGYVSDAPALYDWMRIEEIGWFTASFYGGDFQDRYREMVNHFALPLDRKIRHLSKGQRAKVALSLAIAPDPELLILDEPTSGLDPHVRREFLESMVERAAVGKTVLLSSHQISEVERVADRVAILRDGKVQLCDALEDLKDEISELTITLSDSITALPIPAPPVQVLSESAEGRQRRWMVRNFGPEQVSELERRPGVVAVRSRRASLEELFIACTRGQPPIPTPDDVLAVA